MTERSEKEGSIPQFELTTERNWYRLRITHVCGHEEIRRNARSNTPSKMRLRGRRAAQRLCPGCLKKYCTVQHNYARLIQRDCLEMLPDFMYAFLDEDDAISLHVSLLDFASIPADDNPVFWLRKDELSILDWLLFLAHVANCPKAIYTLEKIEKSIHEVYNAVTVPIAGRLEEDELMGLKSDRRTPKQNLEAVIHALGRTLKKQKMGRFAILYTETVGRDNKSVVNLFLHPCPVPEVLTESLLGVYTSLTHAKRDILFWMNEREADIRI